MFFCRWSCIARGHMDWSISFLDSLGLGKFCWAVCWTEFRKSFVQLPFITATSFITKWIEFGRSLVSFLLFAVTFFTVTSYETSMLNRSCWWSLIWISVCLFFTYFSVFASFHFFSFLGRLENLLQKVDQAKTCWLSHFASILFCLNLNFSMKFFSSLPVWKARCFLKI